MIRQTLGAVLAATILTGAAATAQETDAAATGQETEAWLPSLMTETPQEGFDLAISIARKAVTTTQPEVDTLMELRPAYSHDPESLIDVSGVVASYFATIAAANDYWRE